MIFNFFRFTKNLSPDQLQLSLLRGTCRLETLELEENALMELLDLPTWLLLKKATCYDVTAKVFLLLFLINQFIVDLLD